MWFALHPICGMMSNMFSPLALQEYKDWRASGQRIMEPIPLKYGHEAGLIGVPRPFPLMNQRPNIPRQMMQPEVLVAAPRQAGLALSPLVLLGLGFLASQVLGSGIGIAAKGRIAKRIKG